jgi:hypothetical protein
MIDSADSCGEGPLVIEYQLAPNGTWHSMTIDSGKCFISVSRPDPARCVDMIDMGVYRLRDFVPDEERLHLVIDREWRRIYDVRYPGGKSYRERWGSDD